ncbi:MAG: ribosome biogenesis GTP-binding protein YihA/YsxC [Clostridiales bacterium]|nr:ribosome biogenesis GTP-binding protein YihA/YsxC [Clostridiales bacterium]
MNFNNAQFEKAYGLKSQLEFSGEGQVVFAGRSNVGKSSLINKLFNRKNLARVSSVPGKTVTINYYRVDSKLFVDLPGYGYAKASKGEILRFSALTQYYFEKAKSILLVILLIDMRREPTKDDYDMISYLNAKKMPFIIVLTKADKLNKTQFKNRCSGVRSELGGAQCPVIPFSALSGMGTDEIKKEIEKAFSEQQ